MVAELAFPARPFLAVDVGTDRETSVDRLGRSRPTRPAAPPLFDPKRQAVGVGTDEPETLPAVRSPGMSSPHHKRPAGVAVRFQLPEQPVSPSNSASR